MSKLQEYRNALISKQALYNKSVSDNKIKIEKIQQLLNNITEEDVALLDKSGINLRNILEFDISVLKDNQSEYSSFKNKVLNELMPMMNLLEKETRDV